MWYHELITQ